MNCNEVRLLIPAYFDGELDLVRSVEVERHLQDCGDCTRQLEAQKALRQTVRSASLARAAPVGMDRRMLAAVQRESRAAAPAPASSRPFWLRRAGPALAFAGLAALAAVFWLQTHALTAGRQAALADEAVSSHLRSLQAAHLFDVASTNQHTVKPWFTGKLDFSPPVVDLAAQDYPLAGGRLDYLDGRPVAALVYHKRLHVINLFVWPTAAGRAAPELEERRGYHVEQWSAAGMEYCAVSDVNAADLREFCALVAQRAAAP
ncbi:MAG TPA: zf-HC2 domain-containing protein [Chthonomonadaceae bacterium]|nr:zf-HC2 domain-containing protein [Chthonomonadaceae bacterium]